MKYVDFYENHIELITNSKGARILPSKDLYFRKLEKQIKKGNIKFIESTNINDDLTFINYFDISKSETYKVNVRNLTDVEKSLFFKLETFLHLGIILV